MHNDHREENSRQSDHSKEQQPDRLPVWTSNNAYKLIDIESKNVY